MRRLRPLLLVLAAAACGDSAAPEPAVLAGVYPADAAVNVAAAPVIRVTYTGAVTVPAGEVLRVTGGTRTVSGTLQLAGRRALEFGLADVLEPATRYTVELLPAVRDATGALLPGRTWSFTTSAYLPAVTNAAAMAAHAGALAHDSMGGRRAATADEWRAGAYLHARLAGYGLAPVGYQDFTYKSGASRNVLATLDGAGALRSEWVVIGAHYDHVGRAPSGAVYNGADDNASGTAMLLELARVLAAHAQAGGFAGMARRSVLFIGFGAEEAGLVGSNYFCANPQVSLGAINGMLNLDMVGRLRGGVITVHGLESSPDWGTLVERYRSALVPAAGGLIGTDYRCFLQNGTPAVALFTGMHNDYHQVTDDVELLNLEGMVEVANLALGLATNLMLRPNPLRRP